MCIVGAGITGLSVAYHLQEAGCHDVLVVDRVGVGGGASSIQPGGVRQQWGSAVNCLLARESYGFYRDVSDRLELSVPARLDQGGYLFLASTPETQSRLRRNRAVQNECGVPSVSLAPDEAGRLVPGLDTATVLEAFFCAEDGYFDRPQAIVAGFAASVAARGSRIEVFGVADVARDGGGWVLRDDAGRQLRCEQIVVAAGCDSPAVVASLGVSIPIESSFRHLFYSEPIGERLLEPLVVSPDEHFAAKQLADGSVLASDLSAEGGTDRVAEWRGRVRHGIETLLPILEYVTFSTHVQGAYDLTPDSQAILGPVDGIPGLWLATGLSGRGFMMAPAIGRILADALVRGEDDPLMEPLRLGRFARRALTPEPQVV